MSLFPSLLAACLIVSTSKGKPRSRLLHAPCGDGTMTAELAEAKQLVAYGVDPLQPNYLKASTRLNAAECASPTNVRIYPNQCVHILWLSPGAYHVAAALHHLAPSLYPGALIALHLSLDQLTQALGHWLLTQTVCLRAFSLPGPAQQHTRLLLASYAPNHQHTSRLADDYIKGLMGPQPILSKETAPVYVVPDDDTTITPYLYSGLIDLHELHTLIAHSPLWHDPHVLAELRPVATPPPQPLLPTKPGHLALHIAAGLLNGHEITYNGHRLLIKGQTTKTTVSFVDETLDSDGQPSTTTRTLESFATVIRALDMHTGTLYDIR
jgi:hypothetical protein